MQKKEKIVANCYSISSLSLSFNSFTNGYSSIIFRYCCLRVKTTSCGLSSSAFSITVTWYVNILLLKWLCRCSISGALSVSINAFCISLSVMISIELLSSTFNSAPLKLVTAEWLLFDLNCWINNPQALCSSSSVMIFGSLKPDLFCSDICFLIFCNDPRPERCSVLAVWDLTSDVWGLMFDV